MNILNFDAACAAGLKTFIRLDLELWRKLQIKINRTIAVRGHWMVISLYDNIDWLQAFSEANPGSVIRAPIAPTGNINGRGVERYLIGISLSNTPSEVLKEMVNMYHRTKVFNASDWNDSVPTKNPKVFVNEYFGKLYVIREDRELSSLEKEYVERGKTLDMYYSFSDDSGAYKRGREAHDSLDREFGQRGLSKYTMQSLWSKEIAPVK